MRVIALIDESMGIDVRMRMTQAIGHLAKPLVARPQFGSAGQRYRYQQVDVDVSDAFTVEAVSLDVVKNFIRIRDDCRGHVTKQLHC